MLQLEAAHMCYLVAGCLPAPLDAKQGCHLVLLSFSHYSAAYHACYLVSCTTADRCCYTPPPPLCTAVLLRVFLALQLEAAHMCYLVAGCLPAPLDAGQSCRLALLALSHHGAACHACYLASFTASDRCCCTAPFCAPARFRLRCSWRLRTCATWSPGACLRRLTLGRAAAWCCWA
jgi:hypothetical protein